VVVQPRSQLLGLQERRRRRRGEDRQQWTGDDERVNAITRGQRLVPLAGLSGAA
jgi:hypothetical protein